MLRLIYSFQAHEELWLECAQKLTTVIQQIIEFAKMVPGFMKLHQDDQIVLLKAGRNFCKSCIFFFIFGIGLCCVKINFFFPVCRELWVSNTTYEPVLWPQPELCFICWNNAASRSLLHKWNSRNETCESCIWLCKVNSWNEANRNWVGSLFSCCSTIPWCVHYCCCNIWAII